MAGAVWLIDLVRNLCVSVGQDLNAELTLRVRVELESLDSYIEIIDYGMPLDEGMICSIENIFKKSKTNLKCEKYLKFTSKNLGKS